MVFLAYKRGIFMNQRDYEIARELKSRCNGKVPVVELRVFGSRARGDNASDSDLDIYVEVERLDRNIRRLIQDIAWEIGLDHSMVIAPVVYSRNEVEHSPARSSPLLEAVREEGIPV
jgi:uncharacterized protein